MDQSLTPARRYGVRRPARHQAGRIDPLMVAVFALAVSAAVAARPSLWFDEAATISASANRSIPELWSLLGNIDAVHGLYYLVMHGRFSTLPCRRRRRGRRRRAGTAVFEPTVL